MKKLILGLLALLIAFQFQSCQNEPTESSYPDRSISVEASQAQSMASKIRGETSVEIAEGLQLDLWASDTLVEDPIAISIDEKGRVFYTSATRQANSEFDIRGHQNWITASISFETVEDRRKFLRETFSADSEESKAHLKDLNEDGVLDWRDLTVEKEQVWFVADNDGDGVAEHARMYIEDYHEEITDVANGVEVHNGEVFVAVGPDMWRTKDTDGDGIANTSESISHGYAVHIGFGGHGMSGAKIGPDGRIWWSIGDIGMNVVDKEGNQWAYPNQGVVVRSELDGSGFEVYSAGVRNTHEFVFDAYGNLISEDNDGDHSGERERLVHLINGSDCGWRTNWQFGKYTDPKNNGYKVWMDEKLAVPRWEGQAAYILPPIQNYINGPTGMVYNPGTALSEEWYDHFFIAEFRGSPTNSPIHAFKLQPKGASFEMSETKEVVKGLLPTGLDFGPDGALYFGDWINGWDTKDQGYIWKIDVPNGAASAIRQQTKTLIQADFKTKELTELGELLKHQDMRIRQKAQFELVTRGKDGYQTLLATAQQTEHQLARVHALWGMGQVSRKDKTKAEDFIPFLTDADDEIKGQAAKMLGDIRYAEAGEKVVPLLKNQSLRVQLLATEALGRMGYKAAFQPIVDMLIANNDKDTWLRHAGMIALGRLDHEEGLVALANHDSKAARIAAVVALRRMKSPKVAEFLNDKEEYIVTEAARAINDDRSIKEAIPALANLLNTTTFTNEPLIRRAINANIEAEGDDGKYIFNFLNYAQNQNAPEAMRVEAIAAAANFGSPSLFDRVDGRYRGEITHDQTTFEKAFYSRVKELFKDKNPAIQAAAIKGAKSNQYLGEDFLAFAKKGQTADVRIAAMQALNTIKSPELSEVLSLALANKEPGVRAAALSIMPDTDLPEAEVVPLFARILNDGTILEQQAAYQALGKFSSEAAINLLSEKLKAIASPAVPPEVHLDLVEAIEAQEDEDLKAQLQAYQNAKSEDDILADYRETLAGGNPDRGRGIFYWNGSAQCTRCHAIFEYGGNIGPVLSGVGERLTKEEILASIIEPSAAYSIGYEMATITLTDDSRIIGTISKETDKTITVKIGKEDIKEIAKSDIKERKSIPSSMPSMKTILTKQEIRDVVAFLATVK